VECSGQTEREGKKKGMHDCERELSNVGVDGGGGDRDRRGDEWMEGR
jgi:hypothetical protein